MKERYYVVVRNISTLSTSYKFFQFVNFSNNSEEPWVGSMEEASEFVGSRDNFNWEYKILVEELKTDSKEKIYYLATINKQRGEKWLWTNVESGGDLKNWTGTFKQALEKVKEIIPHVSPCVRILKET